MPLSAGDKSGHYEIAELLGAGGMGLYYRIQVLLSPEIFSCRDDFGGKGTSG